MDLFGNNIQTIRTLGFYQPFGSLMLPPYYKVETRKVKIGKKPPFPLGKYLFYTTLKECTNEMLIDWCGFQILSNINRQLENEETLSLNGYAIGMGELIQIRPMTDNDEYNAYVGNYFSPEVDKQNWCLVFKNQQRIEPFRFVDENGKALGKQGVGIFPEKYHSKLKLKQDV